MNDKVNRIELDAALRMLSELEVSPETETVPLFGALGRVLARDAVAVLDVPPFDRSPYDGYAIRGEDTALASRETPVTLRVVEELPAGKAPAVKITAGTAAKILTGAPIPEGANAVVKYELTEFDERSVKIFASVKPDSDIARAGEDVRRGRVLARAGETVSPAVAGALAGQGMAQVEVVRRPVVALMSTGSELLEPGQSWQPAKIYNSNVYTLGAYLRSMGAGVRALGSVPDEPELIAREIGAALRDCDMVITTGGASVGDYDFALKSARLVGARVLFWKVGLKPGGSMVASVRGGKLILGLSGNPGAAAVALLRVAAPYIKRLCGRLDCEPERLSLTLGADFPKKSPQRRALRGHLEIRDGEALFIPTEGQGNGIVSSLIGCDLLGDIPVGSPPLRAGEKITAYRV